MPLCTRYQGMSPERVVLECIHSESDVASLREDAPITRCSQGTARRSVCLERVGWDGSRGGLVRGVNSVPQTPMKL